MEVKNNCPGGAKVFEERVFLAHCCNENMRFYLQEDIARGITNSEITDELSVDTSEYSKFGYDYKGILVKKLQRDFTIKLTTSEQILMFNAYIEKILNGNNTSRMLTSSWLIGFEKIAPDGERIFAEFSQCTMVPKGGMWGKNGDGETETEYTLTRNPNPATVRYVHIGYTSIPTALKEPKMTAVVTKEANTVKFASGVLTDTDALLGTNGTVTLYDKNGNVVYSKAVTKSQMVPTFTTATITNIALVTQAQVSFEFSGCTGNEQAVLLYNF